MRTVTPEWLFARAGIDLGGSVDWGQPVPEVRSGIYIITAADPPARDQPVVYIGRSKSISGRLRQFYRHKYGAKAPHRGGQEILLLNGPKVVHWAQAEAYAEAERMMLEAFHAEVGAWPYGNRMKSACMTLISN